MDIVDRMFELVDEKYKEQRDFAKAISVTPSIVSEWRRRKSASYMKFLPTVANALDTTVQWLATGEDSKYRTDWTVPVSAAPLDPESLDVAAAYQQADERSRAMVRLALGLDDDTAIAARGGKVIKKPKPVSAETLDDLSQATAKAAEKENERF